MNQLTNSQPDSRPLARSIEQSQRPYRFATIILVSLLLSAGLILADNGGLALIICAYLGILALLPACPELLALGWLALSPLANYLLRYPPEQALLTFDRITLAILAFSLCRRVVEKKIEQLPLGLFELSWLLLAVYALADCFTHGQLIMANIKTAFDGFLLPLLLFIIVRRGLRLSSMGVLIALMTLAYLLLPIGLYELWSGKDLLAYPGGELFHDGVIRPNGPYLSDNSYALISLLVGLALWHWPSAAGLSLTGGLRWLWRAAMLSAFFAALLPQFRAVAVAMVFCLGLSRLLISGWRALVKSALLAALVMLAIIPLGLLITSTSFFQKRVADPTNAYSRLATYQVAWQIAREHWLRGVGLGLYEDYFLQHHAPKDPPVKINKKSLRSLPQTTPHSNFLSILAELGIIGLLPYLIAHLAIGCLGWQRLKWQRPAASAILVILAAYAGVGATLTSGYYSDLNLLFFWLLGIFLSLQTAGAVLVKESDP